METVTFAEIQKVKSSFEFKNSISSTRNCNEFRFFEPRFTSLIVKVPRLTGCNNFVGKRNKFIFNAFSDLKPAERFENGSE